MEAKFGLSFKVFDREGVHEAMQALDLGANPWATEPRIIASFDFLKRREGAFREVRTTRRARSAVRAASGRVRARTPPPVTSSLGT
jgi:hypothetical protein